MVAVVAAALCLAGHPSLALADGDPASDVLVSSALFLPWDAGISASRQTQLQSVLARSAARGFPVRVALIASASDLGSVTALWRQPQTYAEFLGQELSIAYTGSLLVVMPDGFGLVRFSRSPSVARAALAGISPASSGDALATAAVTAVEHLAAASGHPVAAARPVAASSSPTSARSGQSVAWIVFGVGAVLIVAAWTASLRARPPRAWRRRVSSA